MSDTHFTRVLVVDDDLTSLFLTESLIEALDLADHIATAENGKEALMHVELNCLNAGPDAGSCPQLILLDLNMPIMDGFEFLEALKQKAFLPQHGVKVIILTSSDSSKDKQKALQYPITGYVVKPVTDDKLLKLIG